MDKLKVIIPMAGYGKRLLPLTRHKPKALVRIAEKRLLDYVLDTFRTLENTYSIKYIFIIGYLGDQIKAYMKETHPDKHVAFYVQDQLKGQSHALYLAKEAISGPIVVTYCDTINKIDLSNIPFQKIEGMMSVQFVNDPRSHGVAVMGGNNLVKKLIEKPQTMEHKLVLTGLYYFSEGKELINAIETQIRRNTPLNNEFYLADAINILLENGMQLRTEKVLKWLDAGTPESIIDTNAYLLQNRTLFQNDVSTKTNLLIHPVYVHESSRVENSIIGPNVSIGKNCSISRSIIKDTIIDDESNVIEVMLENSLISKGSSLRGIPLHYLTADNDEIMIYNAVTASE